MVARDEVVLSGEWPAGPFTPAPAVRDGDRLFRTASKSARLCGPNAPTRDDIRPCEFSGNDFSRAKLYGVEFRYGIDLSTCRMPEGPEYLRIDDFPE